MWVLASDCIFDFSEVLCGSLDDGLVRIEFMDGRKLEARPVSAASISELAGGARVKSSHEDDGAATANPATAKLVLFEYPGGYLEFTPACEISALLESPNSGKGSPLGFLSSMTDSREN